MGVEVKKGMNGSGMIPVEYKLICQSDEMEKITKGGIFIPESTREKEIRMKVTVTLVEAGGNAFEDWKEPKPKIGDRVRIAKYAGEFIFPEESLDGRAYQLITDKDVICIVQEETGKAAYAESDQPDYAGDGKYSHLRADGAKE